MDITGGKHGSLHGAVALCCGVKATFWNDWTITATRAGYFGGGLQES